MMDALLAAAAKPVLPTMILDAGLMALLVVVAFAIVRMRSLFGIVMLQGVYSLVCAAWFVSLDAVDVAFTEAAVGAGVSTVLMLAAMLLADRQSHPVPISKQVAPLLVVIVAGMAMFFAIGDMPAYGDVNSPANSYVGMDYMARTAAEIHIPNVVTAVLGSYRGYDTFGEVVVIFAAGLGVLLLLGLNGNAGKWQASPNGQRLSAPAAPAAEVAHSPADELDLKAALKPDAPVKAKSASTIKKSAKPAASKKKTVKAKAAPARAKTAKTKTTKAKTAKAPTTKPKSTPAKTAKAKRTKAAPKKVAKPRGRPKGSKNKSKTGDA